MTASLELITASSWHEALAVRVQEERLGFVASIQPVALIMLAKCWVNPDGQHWFPFLLRDEDRVVGIAAVGVDFVDPQVSSIHHVLIDESQQGRGYGRQLMRLLAQWISREFPSVTRLGLNVLPANETAWNLYASLGFVPVGVTTDDQVITMALATEVAA